MRDTFTTTERDASIVAAYDVEDVPLDPAEAEGMGTSRDDQRAAERADAARARGEYVPSFACSAVAFCVDVRLTQVGHTGHYVRAHRDAPGGGVIVVSGGLTADQVSAALDLTKYEVAAHQGAVWVRSIVDFGADPWA